MILKTYFYFTLVVGVASEGCYHVCLHINSQNIYAERLNLELLLLQSTNLFEFHLHFECQGNK